MGKLVLTNAMVLINGVDLSDHVVDVTPDGKAADVDLTAMGAQGKGRQPGLKDESFTFKFRQDFASAKVDQTLAPLYLNGTGVTVEVRPVNAARSVTNPAYVGTTCYLLEYQPIAGTVGAALDAPVKFVIDGQASAMQRLTA